MKKLKELPKRTKIIVLVAVLVVIAITVIAIATSSSNDVERAAKKNKYEVGEYNSMSTKDGTVKSTSITAEIEGTSGINITEFDSEEKAKEDYNNAVDIYCQNTNVKVPKNPGNSIAIRTNAFYYLIGIKGDVTGVTIIGMSGNDKADAKHIESTNKMWESVGFEVPKDILKGTTPEDQTVPHDKPEDNIDKEVKE